MTTRDTRVSDGAIQPTTDIPVQTNRAATNEQPAHNSDGSCTEQDTPTDISCVKRQKYCWALFYLSLFVTFSILLVWCKGCGNWPFGDEMPSVGPIPWGKIIAGCLISLPATLYLFLRHYQLYQTYNDDSQAYLPTLYSYAAGGVFIPIGCMLLGFFWKWTFSGLQKSIDGQQLIWSILESTVFGGAIPEEILKYVVYCSSFWFFGSEMTSDLQLRVLVLQTTAAGLSFGTVEGFFKSVTFFGDWNAALFRGVWLVPFHAMLAYISGCWYLRNVLETPKPEDRCCLCNFASCIWCSILLHAVYNTLCVLESISTVAAVCRILIIPLAYFIGKYRFRLLKEAFSGTQEVDQESGLQ